MMLLKKSFLLIVLLNILFANNSQPTIKISSSIIYPRLSLADSEEIVHWRSILSYDQRFGDKIGIDGLFEYGSANDNFKNPFRVHHFTIDLNLWKHEFKLGRIAVWNSLQNTRVDGAQLDLRTDKYGTLSLVGGLKAVTDFSDTLFTDNTYFMASWSKNRIGKNLTFSYWMKGDAVDIHSFTGMTFNTSLFGIRISNALALDIDESQLNYAKIRLSKKFGNHTAGLGFRQKRFEYYSDYVSISDKAAVAPTITFDVNSLLSERLLWRNQFSYRVGEQGIFFAVSSINYKNIYASILGGFERKDTMYGMVLGATHRLSGPLSFGGSFAFNALDYGDFADIQQSTSAYGWVGWQPKDFIMLKLYGRFSTNPYFEQDGRGGIIINVAF